MSRLLNFSKILIFFVSVLLLSTVLTIDPTLSVKRSAVQVGSYIEISWNNFSTNQLDPRLMFWQTRSSPKIDQNYIEGSWEFTYGGTDKLGKYATSDGVLAIKAPALQGLFKVHYCYTNTRDEMECSKFVEITVIECSKFKLSTSLIEHVIVILSENHSFDSIYGGYCKAKTHSNPTCNEGSECCESAPETVNGIKPQLLTDLQNSRFDPCHSNSCEYTEINGGKMDKYIIDGYGAHPNNFAVANGSEDSAKSYWDIAKSGAIGDNFFQSSSGASSQNDMYFATAKFMFEDNSQVPQSKDYIGSRCYNSGFINYNDPTIADMLNECQIPWTFYAEGYGENPSSDMCYPLYYDASDNPFAYFKSLTESKTSEYNFRDLAKLYSDLVEGTLPSVSWVKGLGIHSEHPGMTHSFKSGQELNDNIISAVKKSSLYNKNTLILLVPDESGGFYDHKSPPPASTVDGTQYGPRTQFIAIGHQAKTNFISHVQMEPSSIVKFIQWNWFGTQTGQLGQRDAIVNNIGDLLDKDKCGLEIPSN